MPTRTWKLTDRSIEIDRPLGVGIVNVTTDSFYSGARSGTPEQAVRDAVRLVEDEGFDVIDLGAIPARAGPTVSESDEATRLIPAIEGLAARLDVPITADTFNPAVARMAIEAGAHAINDISGGSDAMFRLVADLKCGYVLMHIEGPPRVDRVAPEHPDVVTHLHDWFTDKIAQAESLGVAREQIAVDPGPDFDLNTDQDLDLIRRQAELHDLGCPLFVALSRKDFLGAVLAGSWEDRYETDARGNATLAAVTMAVEQGAHMLRLHDRESLEAMRVADRILNG